MVIYNKNLNLILITVLILMTSCKHSAELDNSNSVKTNYKLLDGNWKLDSVYVMSVKLSMSDEGNLKVNTTDSLISGFTGCNNFNGNILNYNNIQISTSPFAVTKKMCFNMEQENLILNILSSQSLKYSVSEKNLIIGDLQTKSLYFTRVSK